MFRAADCGEKQDKTGPAKTVPVSMNLPKMIPNPSTKVNCYDIVSEHISYGVCY